MEIGKHYRGPKTTLLPNERCTDETPTCHEVCKVAKHVNKNVCRRKNKGKKKMLREKCGLLHNQKNCQWHNNYCVKLVRKKKKKRSTCYSCTIVCFETFERVVLIRRAFLRVVFVCANAGPLTSEIV